MADARIILRCSCGKQLAVPSSAGGKKTKCPQCGGVLSIPAASPGTKPSEPRASASAAPVRTRSDASRSNASAGLTASRSPAPTRARPTPSPAPTRPADESEGDYGIVFESMLADETSSSAASTTPAKKASCPECGELMADGAVICIACGYDQRSGKVLKTKRRKESAAGAAAVTAGKFIIGVVLSVVAALVGVAAWIGIAIATGYEIGWIAWGLGGLVGFAMRIGYREETQVAGFVAAGIAFFGVAIVKGIEFAGAMMMRAEGQEVAIIGLDGVFGPFEVLFVGLAVVTAYKVASGISRDE